MKYLIKILGFICFNFLPSLIFVPVPEFSILALNFVFNLNVLQNSFLLGYLFTKNFLNQATLIIRNSPQIQSVK